MKSSLQSKYALLAGVSALAVSAAPAIAQEDGASETRRLSKVTVSATQREESIQDIPIAVTAVTAEDLARAGVRDLTTLEDVAPSFISNTSDTNSGGATFRLRGVGTTGNNLGLESSVATFIDGVYVSRPGIALADLLDLEQIEVLRGPQGTLFGRNTSAGALNIKTRKPNLSEFESFGNFTVGNYDLFATQLGVNIPLVEDKFAVRLSGASRERDGFISGINGFESHVLDRVVLRGQALADFGSRGTVRAILNYAQSDDQCCDAVFHNDNDTANTTRDIFAAPVGSLPTSAFFGGNVALPSGNIDSTGGAPNIPGPSLNRLDGNNENFVERTEGTNFSLEYNVDTPLGALTYIGSYGDFTAAAPRNNDFVGADVFTVGRSPEGLALPNADDIIEGFVDIETQTHELRLKGTAFNDRLDWLIGAYYSDEDISAQGTVPLLGDLQEYVDLSILGGALGNSFNGSAQGVSAEGDFGANVFAQDGESFSIFTHNVLSITDKFDVTVGLRYVDETKDASFEQIGGQFNACDSLFANVAANSADSGANSGFGAVPNFILNGTSGDGTTFPAGVGDVIQFDELSVAVNCFVFSAPVFDPDNPREPHASLLALAADPNDPFSTAAVDAANGDLRTASQAALLRFLPQEFDEKFEDDELVYTIKGSYQITPTANVYAGFTRGFKSGGFNLDPSAAAGGASPQFNSEKVDAWEAGIKADILDGRARINVAAFFQEMEDFQVLEFTGTRFQTFNVDKAESTGFEVESLAQITDNLTVNLAVTYADAKYPNDCTSFDINDPDFVRAPLTLCGNSLTNAPEWTTIFGATYQRPILDGAYNFFATGSVRHETDRRTSTQPREALTRLQLARLGPDATEADIRARINGVGANGELLHPLLPGDIQDDNTKVNLRLGIESADQRWGFELWGNNIFDERTKNVTFNIPLRGGYGNRARGQFVQAPATFGATLRYRY